MAVVELDAEHRVGQGLDDLALELDLFLLRHAAWTVAGEVQPVGATPPISGATGGVTGAGVGVACGGASYCVGG